MPSYNESKEPVDPNAFSIETQNPAKSRPQSPSELSKRLAGSLNINRGITDITPEQRSDSGEAWIKAHEDVPSQLEPTNKKVSRSGWLAGAAAAAVTLATATGFISPNSVSSAESPTVELAPKTEEEQNFDLVMGATSFFNQKNGEVIHPNIQRFSKPDGKTPKGDPRWNLDTNLTNPQFKPVNKQQPPKLNVVLQDGTVLLNTNVASLFPELSSPDAVSGEDLREVINTLLDKPEDYQVHISERTGSGDDGAGDDMKVEVKAIRNIEGKLINVTVNSVGGFTMTVPKALIQPR